MDLKSRNIRLEEELWDKTDKLILCRDALLVEAQEELAKLKEERDLLQGQVDSMREVTLEVENLRMALSKVERVAEERRATSERVLELECQVEELGSKLKGLEIEKKELENQHVKQVEELKGHVDIWNKVAHTGFKTRKEIFVHTMGQFALLNPGLKYDAKLVKATH